MKRNRNEVRVKRYLFSMIIISIIFVSMFYYLVNRRDTLKEQLLEYQKFSNEVLESVHLMQKATDQLTINIKEYVITNNDKYLDNYHKELYMNKNSNQAVELTYDIDTLASARAHLEKALIYINELSALEKQAIDYMNAGKQELAKSLVFSEEHSDYKNLIYNRIDNFTIESEKMINKLINETNSNLYLLAVYTYILIFAFVVLVIVVSFHIYNNQKGMIKRILKDPLTKALNHQALYEFINTVSNKGLNCIVVDLIDFKFINEMYGHQNADYALIEITYRLTKKYNKKSVFRISGNRFVVLTKKSIKDEELKDLISLVNSPIKNQYNLSDIVIDCAVGVATKELSIANIEELVDIASLAAIISENNHKNSYTYATLNTVKEFSEKMNMKEKLDDSITDDTLYPEYQLIVDPHNDKVVGMESIAKWYNGVDVLDKFEFYDFSKKVGLIFDIDITIFNRAVKDLSKLILDKKVSNDFFVAISLSHLSILRLDLGEMLNLLYTLDLKPNNIRLDFTNEAFDSIDCLEVIKELSELGFNILIESIDFDLSKLNDIPDISIGVKDIIKYSVKENEVFYQMLLDLTNKLNLDVSIKNIKKSRELKTALEFKNVNVQGLYYSKPLDMKRFEQLLTRLAEGTTKLRLNH